jgi:acyl-coenzyme A thioesterase PaaI-like protein
MQSLQDQYAAKSICFGCGPANPQGFQIKSVVDGDRVVAHYHPKPFHQAFPGVLNGGVIGTLLDCHCNWAACWFLMQNQKLSAPPCTVTAEYTIKLLRPTPCDTELELVATLKEIKPNSAIITGTLQAGNKICATCEATFVAVTPDHPAYHRW